MERVAGEEGPRPPGLPSRCNRGGAGEASTGRVHTGGDGRRRGGEAWSAKPQQRMPQHLSWSFSWIYVLTAGLRANSRRHPLFQVAAGHAPELL
jgi:hypothetical protein